jgi:putative endopeptidase
VIPRTVPVHLLTLTLIGAAIAAQTAATPSLAAQKHGVKLAYMNTKVAPCEDFWQYANGAWVDTVQIPPTYVALSTGREVFDRNQEILRTAVERAAAGVATEKDATVKKVGILYAALMDSARAERDGLRPVQPLLDQVAAIRTRGDVQRRIADITSSGMNVPFNMTGEADFKHSSRTIGALYQAGLGLPDRDFYFRTDPKSETVRKAYMDYATKTFQMLGDTPEQSAANAQKVMAFEKSLAESSLTRVQMREAEAIYHNLSVAELQSAAPGMDWAGYFKNAGLNTLARPVGRLNVTNPGFARQVAHLVATAPIDDWKAYLRFAVMRQNAGWIGDSWYLERFRYQAVVTGQQSPLPRWKRAVQAVDGAMGEAVGKAYVAQAFGPEAKARMAEMVDNLQSALSERIAGLDWMSDATKAAAQKKLAAITKKIGYPDKWRDYTALAIDATKSAAEDLRLASAFEQHRVWKQIDTPVDRLEWGMSPSTVNAYYNPSYNEIVFPAGILQPPYFDPTADDAMNYGSIGSVIGHEMTHGFDDEGRKFDADGNLKMWWTDTDDEHFKAKAQRVVDQFNGYVGVDTLHVNGALTLGENIADLGGLKIAFDAYQRYLQKHGREDLDGFTPEQRFFIGYAQEWRNKMRPETMRTQILTNPHSPNFWRVNGPLSNSLEFRKAFGCKEGDAMVRPEDKRASIW